MTRQCANGEVEFSLYRPAAHRVYLLGDFNRWETTALPLRPVENGWWRCQLPLGPGVYQFRYLVDGQWFLDYAAFGLDQGPLGAWNSVVVVEPPPFKQNSTDNEPVTPGVHRERMERVAGEANVLFVGSAA